MTLRKVILILLPLVVFSCSRPKSQEQYVRCSSVDALGRYNFRLDVDSSGVYDLDILLFMSVSKRRFTPFSDTLSLEFQAPSGSSDFLRIPLPPRQPVQEDFFKRIYQYPLEYNIPEIGEWGINLTLPSGFAKQYGIEGIGLETKKHGTR